MYKGGEPCDITGEPRKTEVRFVCSEASKEGITGMRETATCQYRLTFSTPKLCTHPAFRAPQAPVHHVLCTLAADSAAAAAAAAVAVPGDGDGDGGAAVEGEADPPPSGEEDPAVAAEGGSSPESSMADLQQAIKDVGEGLGVNTSLLESALINTDGGVANQVAAGQKAAAAAQSAAEAASEPVNAEEPKITAEKGNRESVVGPPAPPERDPDEEVFYYDDDGEGEEEEDDLDFSRSGMHAEL